MSEREERPKSRVQMAKEPFPLPPLPLGYEEICRILPHRYPLLLVDRIVEIEPGVRCVGLKNVTANEEFFQGHFPGHPVMPGVLLLEAMAQVAGILTLVSRNTPGALSYFAGMKELRFHQPVRPGDQFVTEATLLVLRGPLCKVHVVGRVNGEVVVESEYTFFTANDGADKAIVAKQSALTADTSTHKSEKPVSATSVSAATPLISDSPVSSNGSAANVSTSSSNGSSTHSLPATPVVAAPLIVTPPRQSTGQTFIHPTALVDSNAQIGQGVWIGPHCIIEGETQIGDNCVLEANVVIKAGTSLGQRCRIWPNVILGHEPQDVKYRGEQSFLRIGDDNILREMVTIHRGTGEGTATVIGNKNC
jgi:beta-hydroxyacyl-ACP dehydratase FabZ